MDFSVIKKSRQLQTLLVLSIAIFPSLFLGAKIMGIVFLLYFIVIVWNLYSTIGGNILSKLSESAWENGIKAKEEGKHFKSSIYFIAFPMVIIGVVMILLQIFMMFIG